MESNELAERVRQLERLHYSRDVVIQDAVRTAKSEAFLLTGVAGSVVAFGLPWLRPDRGRLIDTPGQIGLAGAVLGLALFLSVLGLLSSDSWVLPASAAALAAVAVALLVRAMLVADGDSAWYSGARIACLMSLLVAVSAVDLARRRAAP